MTIKTNAAIAYEIGKPMVIEQVKLDPPGKDDVLVEVRAAGLRHTDLCVWEGHSPIGATFPGVLGHEGAGIVLETGSGVTDLQPGDHVITFAPEYQVCGACHSSKGNFCESVLSGYGAAPSITAGSTRLFAGYAVSAFVPVDEPSAKRHAIGLPIAGYALSRLKGRHFALPAVS